jgi:group I intron endonuclease
MKSGIYKITINNKTYVGRDTLICNNKRKKYHLLKLKKCTHPNKYLQNAFDKYNEFEYEIIEMCDVSELNQKEIYWIDTLNSIYTKNGYNLTSGGDVCPSELLSNDDMIIRNTKISNTLKEYYRNNENPFKGKSHTVLARKVMSGNRKNKYSANDNPYYRHDITNDMIRTALINGKSIKAAARILNCSSAFIGYRINSNSMILKYKNNRTIGRGVVIEDVII